MLVSHDRALLREVCDEFWLVARGEVQPFDGDLDDYQKWLLDVSRAAAKGQPLPAPPKAAVADAVELPKPAATAPGHKGAGTRPQAGAGHGRDDRKQGAQTRSQLANLTRPLRVEIQQIDGRMEKLAAERAALEQQLATGKRPASEIAETGRRLNHIAAEVGQLEERWLQLQSELEAMQAGA